ncbi:hypothetical protein ETD86_15205 [Nonomuraea turkmeniaca]|uniref:Exo-alpha-sialidase n=1 Tax=Nonomuraea turkmeniaca TaxID=103838 RepID=A0A5S4FLB5_9ACTN|nr:hypothetical protein [Nonomuraea turkmeniaca]TMR21517.1 hypothetical protein ETD86_15205 [Nonomuraea turkmeniaca]
MRRRAMCLGLAAALLLGGCSPATDSGTAEPTSTPQAEASRRRCHLDPSSTLPPTPPALPSGDGARLVHYNAYPYSDGFRGVVALPDGTVYAVGQREEPRDGNPCGPRRTWSYALRWDGTRWHELPELGEVVEPQQIAASDDGDLWVFGHCPATVASGDPDGCAARWDGTSWSPSVLDNPQVAGAAVLGRNDVWTATYDALYHWNGERWQDRRPPLHIRALNRAPSGQMWIAGDKDGQVTLARWSGHRWDLLPRPRIPRLYGSKQGETMVHDLAVGEQGEVWVLASMYWTCGEEETQCTRPVLMRWSGGQWLVKAMSKEFVIGQRIVSDGAGGLWMVVSRGLGRFTGGKWKTYPITRGPFGGRSVAALARRPGAATLWAVGEDQTEAEEMPFTNGMIWRLDAEPA